MQSVFAVPGKPLIVVALIGLLLLTRPVAAADDWELDLEITGWTTCGP